jgi:hypothetical protein
MSNRMFGWSIRCDFIVGDPQKNWAGLPLANPPGVGMELITKYSRKVDNTGPAE